MKKSNNTIDKVIEQLGLSYTNHVSSYWYNHFRKLFGDIDTNQHTHSIWPIHSITRYGPIKDAYTYSPKIIYRYFYFSAIIHNMLKKHKCTSSRTDKSCNKFVEVYCWRQIISGSGNNSCKLTVNNVEAKLWEMKVEASGSWAEGPINLNLAIKVVYMRTPFQGLYIHLGARQERDWETQKLSNNSRHSLDVHHVLDTAIELPNLYEVIRMNTIATFKSMQKSHKSWWVKEVRTKQTINKNILCDSAEIT